MSTAASRRQILSELSSSKRGGQRRSGKTIALWVVGAFLGIAVLVAAGGWYWWRSAVNDPRVVSIVQTGEQIRERFFSTAGPSATAPMSEADAAEMVTAMTSLREQMETLPDYLRPIAGMQVGRMFMTGMQQRIDDYFETPPAQRRAVLDRQIQQMEAMRAAFTQNGGNPPGPPRTSSEGDRNEWRKRMIDRTTPEQRAKFTEYGNAIDQRRRELGLETSGWGR